MINILIVDDHLIVREGIKRIINDTHDIKIVAEAAESKEALNLILNNKFDLILDYGTFSSLDIQLALPELIRVLKPNGTIIAVETLGHNPLFNLKGEVVGINTAIIAPGQSGSIGIGLLSVGIAYTIRKMVWFSFSNLLPGETESIILIMIGIVIVIGSIYGIYKSIGPFLLQGQSFDNLANTIYKEKNRYSIWKMFFIVPIFGYSTFRLYFTWIY